MPKRRKAVMTVSSQLHGTFKNSEQRDAFLAALKSSYSNVIQLYGSLGAKIEDRMEENIIEPKV